MGVCGVQGGRCLGGRDVKGLRDCTGSRLRTRISGARSWNAASALPPRADARCTGAPRLGFRQPAWCRYGCKRAKSAEELSATATCATTCATCRPRSTRALSPAARVARTGVPEPPAAITTPATRCLPALPPRVGWPRCGGRQTAGGSRSSCTAREKCCPRETPSSGGTVCKLRRRQLRTKKQGTARMPRWKGSPGPPPARPFRHARWQRAGRARAGAARVGRGIAGDHVARRPCSDPRCTARTAPRGCLGTQRGTGMRQATRRPPEKSCAPSRSRTTRKCPRPLPPAPPNTCLLRTGCSPRSQLPPCTCPLRTPRTCRPTLRAPAFAQASVAFS